MIIKSNQHIRKLRFGSGTLRKITQNGHTGPSTLKRPTMSKLQAWLANCTLTVRLSVHTKVRKKATQDSARLNEQQHA